MKDIKAAQEQEINFWRDSDENKPGVRTIRRVLDKMVNSIDFLDCLAGVKALNWSKKMRVLEIGGGQGWASCLLKSTYPNAHVTLTDISPFAVESVDQWEDMFKVKIDEVYHCKSNETKEEDNSIDFIFTFAAAHHFITHRKTINEISRILKPGGSAAYFFEPVTQVFWYPMAYKRVNKIRPEVPEDVLIINKIRELSIEADLEFTIIRTPTYSNRLGYVETLYYLIMNTLPFLQNFFPHTATILFTKKIVN